MQGRILHLQPFRNSRKNQYFLFIETILREVPHLHGNLFISNNSLKKSSKCSWSIKCLNGPCKLFITRDGKNLSMVLLVSRRAMSRDTRRTMESFFLPSDPTYKPLWNENMLWILITFKQLTQTFGPFPFRFQLRHNYSFP